MKKIILRIIDLLLIIVFINYLVRSFYLWSIKIALCSNKTFENCGEEENIFIRLLILFSLFYLFSIFIAFYLKKKHNYFSKLSDYETCSLFTLIAFTISLSPMMLNMGNLQSYAKLLSPMRSQLMVIQASFHESRSQNYKNYLYTNKERISLRDTWNEKLIIDPEKELIISKGADKTLNTDDDAFIKLFQFDPLSEEDLKEIAEMKKSNPELLLNLDNDWKDLIDEK